MKFLIDFINEMFLFVVLTGLWIAALVITLFVSIEHLATVRISGSLILMLIMALTVALRHFTGRNIMSSDWLVNRITNKRNGKR